MELGCFLAGALISSQGHMVTEEIVSYIEPIRDFLVIIFFASIGNLPCLRQDVCRVLDTRMGLLQPVYIHISIYAARSCHKNWGLRRNLIKKRESLHLGTLIC